MLISVKTSVLMSTSVECMISSKPKSLSAFCFMVCILPRNFTIVKDGIDIIRKNSINILTNIYICSIMISDRKISM